MDLQLHGKFCLVTGASAGIGVGVAKTMAREGVNLAITARRKNLLYKVAEEIKEETGKTPVIIEADLMNSESPKNIQAQIQSIFGGLDILINNAGLSSKPDPIATDEEWNAGFDLKFTTVRRLTNAFLPTMIQRGWGRIINITGVIEPLATSAALVGCAAVHSWAKGLSRDVASQGITVNCIPPGRIDSEQIRETIHPTLESRNAFIRQYIPLGRFGKPEDLANLAAFLSSPLADYITGTVIPVDGGMSRFAM